MSRKFAIRCRLFGLLLLMGIGAARADVAGDAARGGDVFDAECSDCHSLKAGKNKKGPSLLGVVGRKSASIADFNYSDAMRASGIVWTPDKIDAYITHPKQVVPNGKMKYDGLSNAKAREDLLAFLMTVH